MLIATIKGNTFYESQSKYCVSTGYCNSSRYFTRNYKVSTFLSENISLEIEWKYNTLNSSVWKGKWFMHFAHWPEIVWITTCLYNYNKPCTEGCNSQSLYHISLFIFVKCTEQYQYHNINYFFHTLYAIQVAYFCPGMYIVIVVGEVKNCFVMWFLWTAAQTSTEAQQHIVYSAQ